MTAIDSYREERECVFRGERYSVRDNGAVMRHANPAKRPRPMDGVWTFGWRDGECLAKNSVPTISNIPIGRIVAAAFLGARPSEDHVVTHLDGDIRNNRVENLRWETVSEVRGRVKNRERLAKIAAYRAWREGAHISSETIYAQDKQSV